MAVYTPVDRSTLARFLADYDLGAVERFEGIPQGIENSNFRLETTGGKYVLTIFERRAAAADLPYFLALKTHLAAKGFPAPRPVARRDSAVLGEIAGKPAAIVTMLPGDWPRTPTPVEARSAGGALARLHRAAVDFPMRRENALGQPFWRSLFEPSRPGAQSVDAGLEREIDEALTAIERRWPRDLPTGAIHADAFPDNVLFNGGEVSGVIDFYFACDDLLAYDLAITLNAWAFGADGARSEPHAAAAIEGYEDIRPLSDPERAALPMLMAGASMRFLLTRLHDWLHPPDGDRSRQKDPMEQLRRLRFHLERL